MKLGPATKLDKRKKTPSKKFDDYIMSSIYDVIDISSIYGQFGLMRKPDSRHIVYKIYIFIKTYFLSYKN